jgi:hypothetical protein
MSTILTVTSSSLPIIDISQENVNKEWNELIENIKKCSFIALDLEMSGLGDRKSLSQT